MREVIRVYRDYWYFSPDENGKSHYAVKYYEDGFYYVQQLLARDELDAAMQVIKEEQTNGSDT